MPVVHRRLAAVLVVAIFAVTGGAFLYAQVRKTSEAPIDATIFASARYFSPNGDGRHDAASFTFRLRASQRIDVDVIDQDGRRVRRLVDGESRRGPVRLAWDGVTDTGVVAADAPYRVRVHLHADDRTITIPIDMTVDTQAPVVQAAPPAGRTLVPGLAGDDGRYAFAATASEPVALRLNVWRIGLDGKARRVYEERRGGLTTGRTLAWRGEAGQRAPGQPSPLLVPGSYVVGWTATDRAGNRVQAPSRFGRDSLSPAAVVRVETVALGPDLAVQTRYPDPVTTTNAIGDPFPGPTVTADDPGVHIVAATAGGYANSAPAAVAGDRTTLVVIPTYSWLLRNPEDADGDGYPDVRDGTASLAWPWDTATRDRLRRLGKVIDPVVEPGEYGGITDAEIEDNGVPAGVTTLILPHVRAWSEPLMARLRAFEAAGGELVNRRSRLDQQVVREGDTLRVVGEGSPEPAG